MMSPLNSGAEEANQRKAQTGLAFGTERAGTADFIQYWTAWHLLRTGENPYDVEKTLAVHHRLGFPDNKVILRSPPWTLLLLAPILELPFELSAKAWFCANLLFLLLSVCLLQTVYQYPKRGFYAMALGAVFFYPALENLLWGQLSMFLLFVLCLFLSLIKKQRLLLAGFVVAALSVKPHLFLIAAPLGLLFLLSRREFALLKGLVLGLTCLLLSCLALSVDLLPQWFRSLTSASTQDGITPVLAWKSTSLVGLLRTILVDSNGMPPLWPMWLLPLLGFGIAYSIWKLSAPSQTWRSLLPPVLAVSLSFAPYGWLYDQSLLLILQALIISWSFQEGCSRAKRWLSISLLGGLQLFAVLTSFQEGSDQSSFFWLSPALLLLWFLVLPRQEVSQY